MEKIIKKIAETIGMPVYLDHTPSMRGLFICPEDEGDMVNNRDCFVMLFAAYAKAELASRGVRVVVNAEEDEAYCEKNEGLPFPDGFGDCWAKCTKRYDFRATDPISEAEAILKACAEALTL